MEITASGNLRRKKRKKITLSGESQLLEITDWTTNNVIRGITVSGNLGRKKLKTENYEAVTVASKRYEN